MSTLPARVDRRSIVSRALSNDASPQRLQDDDRHEGGDNVEQGRDNEDAPRVIERNGEWGEEGCHALRGVQHPVVRRRVLATVEIGARRWEQRIDFAPRKEDDAREYH